MLTALQNIAAEAQGHQHVELPMPVHTYAIIAAAFFTILLLITLSYRHVGASRGADAPEQH